MDHGLARDLRGPAYLPDGRAVVVPWAALGENWPGPLSVVALAPLTRPSTLSRRERGSCGKADIEATSTKAASRASSTGSNLSAVMVPAYVGDFARSTTYVRKSLVGSTLKVTLRCGP